jgi:hypothetical protein
VKNTLFKLTLVVVSFSSVSLMAASNLTCGLFGYNQTNDIFDQFKNKVVIDLEINQNSDFVKINKTTTFSYTVADGLIKMGFSHPQKYSKVVLPTGMLETMKASESVGLDNYDKSRTEDDALIAVCYYTGQSITAPFEQ